MAHARHLKVVAAGGDAEGARLPGVICAQKHNGNAADKNGNAADKATCLKSTLLIFLLWPVISPTLVPLY
jgi:hypothetical protein